MLITLDELNKCVKALPSPAIAVEQHRDHWRVPIEPDMPVRPLYEEPSPIGPTFRIATFRVQKVAKNGTHHWRWVPCDEVVI